MAISNIPQPRQNGVWDQNWANELTRTINAVFPTVADGQSSSSQYQFQIGHLNVQHTRQSVPADTWNPAKEGYNAFIAMTQSTTLTINPVGLLPGAEIQVLLRQDGAGARVTTFAIGGGFTLRWNGGAPPVLNTAANKQNIVRFYYDGNSLNGWAPVIGA